jgi:DNA repair exonuclease SbcCD nuclease subunit
MAVNILALGDAHFMVSNTREMKVFLDKLKNYLEKESKDIDFIIILGDVLDSHERLHVTPLNQAIEYVKLCSSYKKTYVLVGNHDSTNNSIFLTTDHWINCLKNWPDVTVVDTIQIHKVKDRKIVMSPYVPDGRFIEALNTRKGEWEDASVIFSHVTIKGADMGNMIAKDADTWDPDYPLLVSGHIHKNQWLAPNMYYTGSIMQVAVDESPEKTISIVTVPTSGTVKVTQVDLVLPKKEILHVAVEEIDDFKVPSAPETKYTLYVSGSCEQFRAFRKTAKFQELAKEPQLGRRIRHKPNRLEKQEKMAHVEELKKSRQKLFTDLLRDEVDREKDDLLTAFYRHLVNDEEDLSAMLDDVLVITPKG